MIIFQTAPAEAHEQDPDTVVFDDDEEHEMELDSEMSSDGEMDAEMSENEL